MPFGIRPRKSLLSRVKEVDLGCGSCMKPKLSDVFHPKPKLKTPLNRRSTYKKHRHDSFSWSNDKCDDNSSYHESFYKQQQQQEDYSHYTTTTTATTTTTFSSNTYNSDAELFDRRSPRMVDDQFGRVGGPSLAVEKESDDPYLDFRDSMLQMILEKEIYSKDELRELLNCFLQLNSPYHHGIIIRAFTEIWNGVFSVKQQQPTPSATAPARRQRRRRPRDL